MNLFSRRSVKQAVWRVITKGAQTVSWVEMGLWLVVLALVLALLLY